MGWPNDARDCSGSEWTAIGKDLPPVAGAALVDDIARGESLCLGSDTGKHGARQEERDENDSPAPSRSDACSCDDDRCDSPAVRECVAVAGNECDRDRKENSGKRPEFVQPGRFGIRVQAALLRWQFVRTAAVEVIITGNPIAITFHSFPADAGLLDITAQMPPTVNARIPLSLLEAIRRIDTPEDQVDTEYVAELRNKRLGLSDTVYTQIRRYNDAMKRGQQVPFAEAEGLGTLIGRRPDADELFQKAGHILAHEVYTSISPTRRGTIRLLPGFLARPMALSQLHAVVEKYFSGTLERTGSFLSLKIPNSATVNGSPKSAGCVFYECALRELLNLLIGGVGQIDHVHCAQRGEGECEWRAEWRSHHR